MYAYILSSCSESLLPIGIDYYVTASDQSLRGKWMQSVCLSGSHGHNSNRLGCLVAMPPPGGVAGCQSRQLGNQSRIAKVIIKYDTLTGKTIGVTSPKWIILSPRKKLLLPIMQSQTARYSFAEVNCLRQDVDRFVAPDLELWTSLNSDHQVIML